MDWVNFDRFSEGRPDWMSVNRKRDDEGPIILTEEDIARRKRFGLYEDDEEEDE